MDWLTTSTILRELRESPHSDAWTHLVQRFHKPIVRFARQMGHSAADAEDVAQETLAAFVKSYRAGRYDRRKGRLSKWLFGIAYRQSCKVRASVTRDRQVGELDERALSPGERLPRKEASGLWDREWENRMIAECLRHVREEVEAQTFRIFEMVVLEGRPAAEVSASLNVSSTVVYNAKHRVIVRCRRWRSMLESVPPGAT